MRKGRIIKHIEENRQFFFLNDSEVTGLLRISKIGVEIRRHLSSGTDSHLIHESLLVIVDVTYLLQVLSWVH